LDSVSTMTSKTHMVVVAIDFGTTYSGYAFSFRSDYEISPMKVSTQNFQVGSTQMPKMPTSVLFRPDQEFHSFGTEAEEKYARLCEENSGEARRWYFFQRFKLDLHMKEVSLQRRKAENCVSVCCCSVSAASLESGLELLAVPVEGVFSHSCK